MKPQPRERQRGSEERSVQSQHNFNNQSLVNAESNFDSLNSSQMSRHLNSDAHERINDITSVTKPFSAHFASAAQISPNAIIENIKEDTNEDDDESRTSKRTNRVGHGLSLNRSQCRGCSTKYDTLSLKSSGHERSLVSCSTGGSKLDGDGQIPSVADVKSVDPFAHAAAYATTTRNRGTEKRVRR